MNDKTLYLLVALIIITILLFFNTLMLHLFIVGVLTFIPYVALISYFLGDIFYPKDFLPRKFLFGFVFWLCLMGISMSILITLSGFGLITINSVTVSILLSFITFICLILKITQVLR